MNIASCYSNPIIGPPIQPDNPRKGVASDHCVPVCFPHLNRYDRPERNRKMIKYRPLPESGKMMFGEWIVKASWSDIQDCSLSPSQKAQMLDTIFTEKLDVHTSFQNYLEIFRASIKVSKLTQKALTRLF